MANRSRKIVPFARAAHKAPRVAAAFFLCAAVLSCPLKSAKGAKAGAEELAEGGGVPAPAGPGENAPDFFVKPSLFEPLWFEFSAEKLVQIPSPASASLKSFEPWPFARSVTGALETDGVFIVAVNRTGFWALQSENGLVSVRKIPALQKNGEFSAVVAPQDFDFGAFSEPFLFSLRPAVILYSTDVWLTSPGQPPENRVWALSEDGQSLAPLSVPAFDAAGAGKAAEIGVFFRDKEFSYFSVITRGGDKAETRYFRSSNLEDRSANEEVPLEKFRQAELGTRPEPPFERTDARDEVAAGRLLADIAGYETRQNGGKAVPGGIVLTLFSHGTGGAAVFRTADADDPAEYRGTLALGRVAAVSSGGHLFIHPESGAGHESDLPPLPQGFVYTLAFVVELSRSEGSVREIVIAAWEERDGWNTGAAGIVFAGY